MSASPQLMTVADIAPPQAPKLKKHPAKVVRQSVDHLSRWTVADIAAHLCLKPDTVRDTVVRQPHFPRAILPTGSPRIRRWIAAEVMRWELLRREPKEGGSEGMEKHE